MNSIGFNIQKGEVWYCELTGTRAAPSFVAADRLRFQPAAARPELMNLFKQTFSEILARRPCGRIGYRLSLEAKKADQLSYLVFPYGILNLIAYPWVLANVRALPSPVPYRHKSGAVTFVTFEREEVEAAARQLGVPLEKIQAGGILPSGPHPSADRSIKEIGSLAPTTASAGIERVSTKPRSRPLVSVPATLLAESCSSTHPVSAGHAITLTGVAIRNGNLSLNSIRHLIPAGGVGGTNKGDLGRPFIVRFDPGDEHETDVAGDKMLLRCRGAVRNFFSQAGAQEGDIVRVDAQDTRTLVFTLQRR